MKKQLLLNFKNSGKISAILDSNDELQGFVVEECSINDMINQLKIGRNAANFGLRNQCTILLTLLEIYPVKEEDTNR